MEPREAQDDFLESPPSSPLERRLSFLIVSLLVLIGVTLAFVQSNYDPSLWRQRGDTPPDASQALKPETAPSAETVAVAGLVPMGPGEQYDALTLSDKINGKAELYLGAGFRRLAAQRFKVSGSPGVWMERYVYDMGGVLNAYAVYSSQRREADTDLGFATHGYLSANGLYFIHGDDYVEIIASESSPDVQIKLTALAQQFVQSHQASEAAIPELALFPTEDQVPGSIMLIADSAFGLEGLDWVYTAAYESDAAQATAYIVSCGTPSDAQALATAFTAYWTEFGGEMVPSSAGLPDARMVSILDAFEIAIVQGHYLMGVHEASHLDYGISLTSRLQALVAEAAQ